MADTPSDEERLARIRETVAGYAGEKTWPYWVRDMLFLLQKIDAARLDGAGEMRERAAKQIEANRLEHIAREYNAVITDIARQIRSLPDES